MLRNHGAGGQERGLRVGDRAAEPRLAAPRRIRAGAPTCGRRGAAGRAPPLLGRRSRRQARRLGDGEIEYESSERPGFLQASVAPESRKAGLGTALLERCEAHLAGLGVATALSFTTARGGVAEVRHRTWFPAHQHDSDLRRRPAHDRAPERPARRRSATTRRARPTKGVRARLRGDDGRPRRGCDGRRLVRAMARGLLASSGHGPRRERCGRHRRQTGRLLAPPRRPGRPGRHRHDRDAA